MERIRKGTETTKKKFPFSVELIAVCMIFIFSWDQVVFADGIPPQDFEKLPALPAVDVTQAASLPVSTPLSEAPSSTQDFLSNGSPLKIPMSVPPKAVAAPKILQSPNPSNGWQLKFTSEADLSYEIQVSADLKNWLTRAVVKADASETSWEDPLAAPGSMRFYRVGISNAPVSGVQYHVYAGDAVQQVIDRAVGSDSVYLHSGVYHQSLILKKDVNLEGEDQKQTIIDGDYAAGKAVLRALGGNRIENLTVRDVRSLQGQTVGAISVEGDQVQVRGDLITNNLGAGIKITAEASGILIEANTFVENNIAIQGAQDGNVIRYNTITGNNPVPAAPAITGVSYVPNQGFRIQIARATGVFSYHVEYSSDLKKWNRVQRALSPGVFEDVLVLANPAGVTTWLDTSATSAGFRFYRIVVAESLTSNTGIEVADGEAPLIENNIITDQKVQSIWEASPGYAVVENNVLFKNGEVGDATGRHLPPAISPQAGSGLPNANVLRDPEFVNPSTGDYTSVNTADAGSFMLASLRSALDRASLFETANVIESIQENGQVSGYRILYAEGSREEFYNDGRRVLDTAPPVITVLSSDVTDQSAYVFRYTLDGVEHHESRTLAEGSNDFNVTAADIFGNRASLSFTVTFERPPEIIVTSPSVASGASYEFIYTVDGVEARETWHLQPGATELLICASRGTATTRLSYTVTLPGTEADLMAMPDVPDTPQDLISLTAQNGLVLKYSNGVLFSIEQPGEYTLFDITLDAGKNLQGGMLRLANGDRILYQNGKPVYLLSSLGARTVYNENGAVAFVLTADHKKIRFAYRRNTAGKVLSVLSFEDGVTSLYDDKGRPLWIKKAGGTEILYQDGFLTDYSDASGNKFHYDVSPLQDGDSLRGYRSELVSVIPAGTGPAIPVATILDNLQDYPSIRDTLERQISRTLEYDASGNMVKVFSVNGEILELQKGLPVSLTNRSGEIFSVQTQVAEDQELLSISLSGNGLEQTYDGNGQLSGIRLEDGTFFQIREQGLDRISLEDGSVLSALVWNGQSLTGFKRLHPDGSVEVYSHSVITERTDAAGNRTLFVDDNGQREAGEIVTEDGKTYRVTSYPNSLGLTERLTELVRIDMPDGSRIEFEDGRPVRYIQPKQVQVDPFEVPDLVEGRFFVPLVELPVAKLRALTVDENGYIFSGEILFNDGTQYLIEDNAVVKQITAGGQFLEFSSTPSPGVALPRIPPEAMTGTEDAYRNHLLETQLDYFMDGKGIHSGTGLPVDHYTGADGKQSDYSQATLVGFWAEILAAIARGDFQNSRMTRSQAFEKLNALIANYQEVQRQAGWNGMVAFFSIVEKQEAVLDPYGNPTGQTRTVYSYKNSFDQYGFGDTLNLSVSLASVIGALQGIALDPELAVYRDQILSRTDQILSEQERGYAAFYDSSQERFHGAYLLDPSTHKWGFAKDYYLDRTFSEFLPGMVWLAARYPQYRQGFSNLGTTLRRYQTEGNGVLDLAVPFDGGAFQMFWPLIHVDETRYPEFEVALRNFLYAQAEFVDQHDIPGLLSAGDNPGQGYEGKIGLPAAAEADDVRYDSIGSLYGTAAAFGLAPHYTLQFLKNLETRFPEIRTSAGFVDALKMVPVTRMDPLTGKYVLVQEPVFSNQYFGVDQASFVLSLLRTSQDYFRNYLDAQGITGSFDTLYQSIQLNLKPLTSGNVEAPDFGQTMTSLYDGGSAMPDGRSAGLVKQAGFVPTIFDPELGEGHIYNYQKPDGTFQHTEIEFGEGDALRVMGIQEYLLRTHHTDMGRAILSGFELDLYNKSVSQGIFYTPDNGYASSMLVNDPELGEVRHVSFDFQDPQHAVGLWNRYDAPGLDLGQYDFLSIPVKIPDGTPENIRLKFEFRGTGNNFLTEPLHHGWQCITIPIARPLDGSVTQIATVIQSVSGQSVRGELYLGPLSAFKVRTSNRLDWGAMLGKTESEIRLLIQSKIATQAFDGGKRSADEVLEDFTIDSTGKLVSGVLKRADGGIQYFQNGQLVKWVFKNGRTVLYEKGIANFFVDLTRGKLETGRFYYDQDLKGEVHSFTLQDNDRKRIFASDGTLKTLIENGNVVEFRDGAIQSIQTTWGTLTQLEFADDGSLLRAHALLNDGRVIEIDERDGSVVGLGDGVQLFCRGTTIVGINTTQNGKTDLTYHYDAAGRIVGVDASFLEGGSLRTLSLFDYLQRPERRVEREQLISKTLDVLSIPDVVVGQFSYPSLPPGESICAWKEYDDSGTRAVFDFRYSSGNGGEILGMCLNHKSDPFEISNYGFLSVTLMQPPEMQWHQDLDLKIKGPYYNTLYSFEIKDLTSRYQTFEFPLAGKSGMEGELTFEVVREEAGEDQWGDVFFKDISYWTLRTLDRSPWEDQIGITAVQLLSLKIESENLTSVGAEIAAKQPPALCRACAVSRHADAVPSHRYSRSDESAARFQAF